MTGVLDLEEARSHLRGLVHLDTQKAAVGLDLTVDSIYRPTGPGRLDFGGGELEPARREALETELRSQDDDYGWWRLDPGTYLVRYNESLDLDSGRWACVLPLERLLLAGASHAAFVVDGTRDPLETLLSVGAAGCDLKENCRVSRVVVMETA